MKKEYILEGLGCANCAAKIEAEAGQLKGIKSSNLNFMTTTLSLQTYPNYEGDITKQVETIVKSHEPSVKVIDKDSLSDEDEESEEGNIYIRLIRAGISLAIFLVAYIFKFSDAINLTLYIIAYLIAGYDVIFTALKNITKGRIFDENFLMGIATIGAFLIGEYPEGVAVMIFYQIGEYFQDAAVNKSRKSIAELMDIRPDYANIMIDGEIKNVSPDEVKTDDIIIVKPGEKVPLDGIVVSGNSMLNTTALTGESVPREVHEGDSILSGCINESGVLTIKVTKLFGESTVSKILDLVQNG